MPALPNILYLHSHDTGRYVQPYGYAVPTPNIQCLAEQGVLFRQAFCAAPTCSPSRAALLTGQCAHSSGMLGLAHRGFRLNDYGQHLANVLRSAGYRSTLVGVQHVAQDSAIIGYDQTYTDDRSAEGVTRQAVAVLKGHPQQPFFLDVGFSETHRPYPAPDLAEALYCRPPVTVPDTAATRRDMAAFIASARILDRSVGEVLAALEDAGLASNTLVISTTDHGLAFPGMKCNLTDHGIGVMLILRGPGGFTGGRVCDALVSQVDLFPTICELAGLPRPDWLQGHSLLPLMSGDVAGVREAAFAEVTYHAAYEPQRAVRTARWTYIRRFGERTTPVLPNCDDSPSKDAWLQAGWRERPLAAEQLYDVVFDPAAACNLVSDVAYSAPLAEMRQRLQIWMEETADPILAGPVAAPCGASVNDPDGLSPSETPVIVA